MLARQSRRAFLALVALPLMAGCASTMELARAAQPAAGATQPFGGAVAAVPAAPGAEPPAARPPAVIDTTEPLVERPSRTGPAPEAPAASAALPQAAPVEAPCPWGSCEDWEALARWIDTEVVPIPSGRREPLPFGRGGPPDPGAISRFREPLPSVPVWNPPGKKRVGLQAGHWETYNAPDELASLRSNPGSSGGGKAEWEVVLEIARRAARLLEDAGVEVDVLPTTIPPRYRAHAFVSIHGDGDVRGVLNGYKLCGPSFSAIPIVDGTFEAAMYDEYGRVTGMPRDDLHITGRMRFYYAFNSRRYAHAVAPGVPQQIVEAGFMTSPIDRAIMIGTPDLPARGIAAGILRFLALDLR
ncbi:MAG: N-acetylmuramoyl-L-alanine amidase [Gemmataceae bacterium]|nr:N-acetylmuramoyl-L-alanine amidase [Gemmataceae bacterium]